MPPRWRPDCSRTWPAGGCRRCPCPFASGTAARCAAAEAERQRRAAGDGGGRSASARSRTCCTVPASSGLARAWVDGSLSGRWRPGAGSGPARAFPRHHLLCSSDRLRVALAARAPRRAGRAAAAADPQHRSLGQRPASLDRPRPPGRPAPLRRLQRPSIAWSSVPPWSTRAPTSPIAMTRSRSAQTRKLDLICRKLRLAPGRAAARHRLRLGFPGGACGRQLRRGGGGDHAVRRAGPDRSRACP